MHKRGFVNYAIEPSTRQRGISSSIIQELALYKRNKGCCKMDLSWIISTA
jgi:hypothetical protein